MQQADVYDMVMRGHALLASGHPHQAATVLERASRLEPGKTSIREALARALYCSGRKRQAGEEFSRLLDLEPSNDYAHFGLGLCQAATGNPQRALGHLKIAVAMRPDSEDYRSALARTQERMAG